MLADNEVKDLKKRNYHKIRELIRISLGLGVNLTRSSLFKDSLRIINLILVISSGFSMYGHWCYTTRYFKDLSKIAEGMSFPYYHIQMFMGGCADYIAGMCAVSFDGVFIVLCVHGVGLIQVLNAMIENSTSPEVPKERRVEYLRYCIFQYQRIYDYVLTIDNIYRQISLSQFLLSLLIWGIVLFQMSIGFESNKMTMVRMVLYLSAAGYEIVIFCYNSQRLTSECEKIPLALYNCEWYNESEEFKQLIRMMILRTNRIFNLNISWFTTMSLPTLMA
ncbi:putative odorant receptor 63a, partial [Lucilia cuprina]